MTRLITVISILILITVVSAFAQAGILPDPTQTEGSTQTDSLAVICRAGYSRSARDVTASRKQFVYHIYGVPREQQKLYVIDHLIPLELGGSNRTNNLWPQLRRSGPWKASQKDRLANYYRRQVCAKRMSLSAAVAKIRSNWTESYKEVFGQPPEPLN